MTSHSNFPLQALAEVKLRQRVITLEIGRLAEELIRLSDNIAEIERAKEEQTGTVGNYPNPNSVITQY